MRKTAESIRKSQSDIAIERTGKLSETAEKNGCLLCGSALEVTLPGLTDNRLGTPGLYEIRRCVQCGFEQTFPVPTLRELTELYQAHYNFGGESDTLYTRLRERFLFSFLYRVWTWLDGDVAFHLRRGTGRFLDIGCNEGRGLRLYARNGFRAEGLELNENAAKVAHAAGFEVHTCLLEDFNPVTNYDVAVLSNVLEHSVEPRQMLVDACRMLAPGGQLWISCPNSQSWLRRAFGRSWINWHVPFHISHFSAETLRKLLDETGYTRVEIRQITPAVWVAQSVIAGLFAKEGSKTWQLRNPFLTLILMMIARFVLFPALWLGNRRGQGDCLLVVATKA